MTDGHVDERDGGMTRRRLLDLDAFYLEHRLGGEIDGDATDERA